MDDSSINPILLSSSTHLENVEQLIKNLEKNTLDLDNFEDILSNRHRHDITKSFTCVSESTMGINDIPDDTFLLKSISAENTGAATTRSNNENLLTDSLFNQRDLFDYYDIKKQQTPPGNDQSLTTDHDRGFTWDDQYDTRANYRLTFSTDKTPSSEMKVEKSHRHKHHHRHHRHKHHTNDPQTNSTYSDDAIPPNLTDHVNDWSMRSSSNGLEQSVEQNDNKPMTSQTQTAFVRSQSHPSSFSPQQQIPNDTNNNNNNNNTSPNSSTTSSSSSASWKRMKDSNRTTSGVETRETRPPSPLSLYKIFQQKSQMAASSSSPRSAFQYYRHQTDSIVPNNTTDIMTISGEKVLTEKYKSTHYQKRHSKTERPTSQTNPSTDQAIQTSILFDSTSNNRFQPTPTTVNKSELNNAYVSTHTNTNSPQYLNVPPRSSSVPAFSSPVNKSLPDLAFISQYTKELPRSRTTSPLPPTSSSSTNSTTVQQKQEPERPRTLKSIKRYKNSKHSTEPLGVFFSPQLGKTFAAVPASAVITGSNDKPTIIKMKLPPPSSYPIGSQQQQQTSNLKSCLKYGSRANSCDIQAMLNDRRSPAPSLVIPEPTSNKDSTSPISKRRCSETDAPGNRPQNLWLPNDSNNYVLQDISREHRSDHDLTLLQSNQTKKSVSFSENIAKHLISPCNPAIKFDPAPELFTNDNDTTNNNELTSALHGDKENLKRKSTLRYGEMRRCQTDVIVVDRIQHLHSFTESPPNEFRLQETDSVPTEQNDEDDQTIMEKTHINILPNSDESVSNNNNNQSNLINENLTNSNDKENKTPEQSITINESTTRIDPTNDPFLDDLLQRISNIVKRIFEIKRAEKTFFLINENNSQLDVLLKNDFCTALQNILEHGLKPQRKDLSLIKQITLWKVIETSIDQGQTLQVFQEAKKIAQNASTYWLYKFQAFIFALLNKNELINWFYYYMKQKEILQRHYQSPDALILAATPSTFNLFDRIMVQLEKLSPLAFRLVYKPDVLPSNIDEQLNTSTISMNTTKNTAKDWVMTISRRASRTLTQPITQQAPPAIVEPQPGETVRSSLSRKFNSLFTKTNPTPTQRKSTSAVTAKLPVSKPSTVKVASPVPPRRPRLSNVFANATTTAAINKPVIVSSPKINHGNRTGTIRRGISPSVVVAPSPPPTLNTPGTTQTTFQSKIPRPSLNVDKPKSARYRSTAVPPK